MPQHYKAPHGKNSMLTLKLRVHQKKEILCKLIIYKDPNNYSVNKIILPVVVSLHCGLSTSKAACH